MPQPESCDVLSRPAAIPLSSHTLIRLGDLIRAERARHRPRWRRLEPGREALLVLALLCNGDTHARLAAGFGISRSTTWRYIREAVDLLATLADDLHAAGERAARLAYAILDGCAARKVIVAGDAAWTEFLAPTSHGADCRREREGISPPCCPAQHTLLSAGESG
jgi:hypothetical protein